RKPTKNNNTKIIAAAITFLDHTKWNSDSIGAMDCYHAEFRGTDLKGGAIGGAPDHHAAEYGVWVGRSMLAQWTTDALALLRSSFDSKSPNLVFAVGQAAPIGLSAAMIKGEAIKTVVLIDPLATFVTDAPYASGTPMGILAPGILKVGD